MPILGAVLAFTTLYIVMPHRRVPVKSALLGGVTAGVAWQLSLLAQVRFQMGVATTMPCTQGSPPFRFSLWVYISLVIVLAGAEIAASHHQQRLLVQRFTVGRSTPADQEKAAVIASTLVVRAMLRRQRSPTLDQLALAAGVPPRTMSQVLLFLRRAGIIVRTSDGGFLPACDPNTVTIAAARDAIRHCGHVRPEAALYGCLRRGRCALDGCTGRGTDSLTLQPDDSRFGDRGVGCDARRVGGR